jgi:hypothetical protein
MAPVRVQEAAGESGFCWLACPFGRRQSSPAGLLQCGNAAPRRARARDRSRLRHRAGALEEPRRAQRGDQHADREEEHRPLVTELTKRRRCAQWPDLFDRPDVRVRTSSAIAQDVPNTENRNIRLVGQPVTLSRAAGKMVARPPEFGEQTDELLTSWVYRGRDRRRSRTKLCEA